MIITGRTVITDKTITTKKVITTEHLKYYMRSYLSSNNFYCNGLKCHANNDF